jgi:hypothetical protein
MKGNQFDGLYVGRRMGNELIYAGKVDHGFDNDIIFQNRKDHEPKTPSAGGHGRGSQFGGQSPPEKLGRGPSKGVLGNIKAKAAGKLEPSRSKWPLC